MIALECVALGKDFGSRTCLDDINLRVDEGSICAVIGPNGAGKTTLLKILATLSIPTRGEAIVCGKETRRASRQVRSLIGYVLPEERSFYWRLTGRQNLRFFSALHGMKKARARERIDYLLSSLGMDGGDRKFRELSTGMKQTLSIARGMLHDPPVLLMDEPTRSLSYESSQRFYDLIRGEAERGKAILLTSHNLVEVDRIADSVVMLREGRIRAMGTPEELRREAGVADHETMERVYASLSEEG